MKDRSKENLFPELATSFPNVKISVKNGWLTLEGEVENKLYKTSARRAFAKKAAKQFGVVLGVSNKIKVISNTLSS
jgi:hypothetical protein